MLSQKQSWKFHSFHSWTIPELSGIGGNERSDEEGGGGTKGVVVRAGKEEGKTAKI